MPFLLKILLTFCTALFSFLYFHYDLIFFPLLFIQYVSKRKYIAYTLHKFHFYNYHFAIFAPTFLSL